MTSRMAQGRAVACGAARALSLGAVPATLALMVPWRAQWDTLSRVVGECRAADAARAGACAAAQTWLDWAAFMAAPPDNPAGAEVARNTMHTLHSVALAWFVVGIVARTSWPARARPLVAWLALTAALLLQPALHTASRAEPRPEPPFGAAVAPGGYGYGNGNGSSSSSGGSDGATLWLPPLALFPSAYADVPELEFATDPPTLVGAFLAGAILRAHTGAGAWLMGVAYGAATLLYAISMRAVATPSVVLTVLSAWALTRALVPVDDDNTAGACCGCGSSGGGGGSGDDDGTDDSIGDSPHLSLLEQHARASVAPRFEIGGDDDDDDGGGDDSNAGDSDAEAAGGGGAAGDGDVIEFSRDSPGGGDGGARNAYRTSSGDSGDDVL